MKVIGKEKRVSVGRPQTPSLLHEYIPGAVPGQMAIGGV